MRGNGVQREHVKFDSFRGETMEKNKLQKKQYLGTGKYRVQEKRYVRVGIHRLAARHSIRAHPEELLAYVTCHSTWFVGGDYSGSSQ